MPEQQPVYSAQTTAPGPVGYIEHPTMAEAYILALRVERASYVARLDRGEELYGGEPVAEIMARIDAELARLVPALPTEPSADDAPVPADEVPYEVVLDGEQLAATEQVDEDDIPAPVKRRRA